MNGPKDPPEPPDEQQALEEQLVEIARAEALLNQRDPAQATSMVRAQLVHQSTEPSRQERRAAIVAAADKGRARRRRRQIAAAISVVVVGLATIPMVRLGREELDRTDALRARLDALGKPATLARFRVEKDWMQAPAGGVAFQMPRDTCTALVGAREGSDEPLALSIERENAPRIAAKDGAIWCSCEGEKVTVKIEDAGSGDARRALRWMSASTGGVGGIEVLAVQPPAPFHVVADAAAQACADAGFRAWTEREGHGDLDPLDAKRPGATADLVADGFEPVGLFAGERMFGVIRAKQGRCYLAAPEPGRVEITLRAADGTRLIEKAGGAVVLCSHAADAVFSLWRAERGSSAVVVMGAPADRVGGITGARAAALRHGYRDVHTALLSDELSKDARASLLAATVLPTSIVEADATGLPGQPDGAVVAFSLREKAVMLPQVDPVVPSVCAPDLDPKLPLRTLVCAGARAQAWRGAGDPHHRGAAEGTRPFWLSLFADVKDEGALRATAALMLFAQRMTLLGYEPTTSDGIEDSPDGAVVSGRQGKGDTVAVGITRDKPWIATLTDGPKWSLTGAIHVVHIPTGATKRLRAESRLSGDPKARRVVVWRR